MANRLLWKIAKRKPTRPRKTLTTTPTNDAEGPHASVDHFKSSEPLISELSHWLGLEETRKTSSTLARAMHDNSKLFE